MNRGSRPVRIHSVAPDAASMRPRFMNRGSLAVNRLEVEAEVLLQ